MTRVEIQEMKFIKQINYAIPKDYLESIRQRREEERTESKPKSKKTKVKKTVQTEEIEVEVD